MTQLLEKAFAEAARLPEEEQNNVAAWLIEELGSEARWDQAFARSANELAALAEEALAEHQAGKTQPLDPEQL